MNSSDERSCLDGDFIQPRTDPHPPQNFARSAIASENPFVSASTFLFSSTNILLPTMIASTLPRCHKLLPHITASPSSLKWPSASVLHCVNPRRSVFTLRPISQLPISEKEMIQRLEKSLQCTQLQLYLSGIVFSLVSW